jgi:hypothetical protein
MMKHGVPFGLPAKVASVAIGDKLRSMNTRTKTAMNDNTQIQSIPSGCETWRLAIYLAAVLMSATLPRPFDIIQCALCAALLGAKIERRWPGTYRAPPIDPAPAGELKL